jgi:predicted outer membrane repeat protein
MQHVSIFNCSFTAYQASNTEIQKAILASSASITIRENLFTGYNLGAIELDNVALSDYASIMNVRVENSIFLENSAVENGGAIYQKGNVALIIENSRFIRNTAKTGGVLLVDCEYFSNCEVIIKNTVMEENFAEIAPTVMSKAKSITLSNSNLSNNTDSTEFAMDRISTYPLKIVNLGDNLTENDENIKERVRELIKKNYDEHLWSEPQVITSGNEFNTTIIVIDDQQNLLVFDNYSRASLDYDINNDYKEDPQSKTIYENLVIEKAQVTSTKGLFRFSNVKIINRPNTTIILNINIALKRDLFFKSTPPPSRKNSETYDGTLNLVSKIKLFVRPCLRGELLNLDYTCFSCKKGVFY